MKHRIVVLLGIILLLGILSQLFVTRISAEAASPVWTVGDSWEYEETGTVEGMNIEGDREIKIIEKDKLTIGGIDYSVFVVSMSGSGTFNGLLNGVQMLGSWSADGREYYEDLKLGLVKYSFNSEFSGTWSYSGNNGPLDMSMSNETTYDIISSDWEYPIDVGDQGTVHLKATTHISIHIDYGSGYSVYDDSDDLTYYEDVTHTCLKTERINVPAGAFDTYFVKEQKADGSYYLHWYSPAAGASVKVESYDIDGNMNSNIKLVSYSYKGPVANFLAENLLYILALIIIPIVIVIIILLVMRTKKKSATQISPQYPQPPLEYPSQQYQQYPPQQPPPYSPRY